MKRLLFLRISQLCSIPVDLRVSILVHLILVLENRAMPERGRRDISLLGRETEHRFP